MKDSSHVDDVDDLIRMAILNRHIIAAIQERKNSVTGFNVVDNRRLPQQWQQLPIRDQIVATTVAEMPISTVDPDAPAYVPDKKPEVSFDLNLSPLKPWWGEFLRWHANAKEATTWVKTFKTLLPGVVGDATLLQVGDVAVARYRRDAQLNRKQLAAEQPAIYAKYTRVKAAMVFDEEAFKAEMPDMHAAYRGRKLNLVTQGGIPLSL